MGKPLDRDILDVVRMDSDGNVLYAARTQVGPKVPLVIEGAAVNSYKNNELVAVAREHWKMLLFTNPTEAISDSNFGCGLYQVLFAQASANQGYSPNIMINKIIEQSSLYLSYLTVTNIKFSPLLDNNAITLTINYSIDIVDIDDQLTLTIKDIVNQGFTGRNDSNGNPIIEDVFNQYNT